MKELLSVTKLLAVWVLGQVIWGALGFALITAGKLETQGALFAFVTIPYFVLFAVAGWDAFIRPANRLR